MALKRKRSTLLSSPTSDTSTSSTMTTGSSPLPSFYNHSKPVPQLYTKPSWSFPTYADDSRHLSSRTMKRHRARDAEENIHASTISKLYQAQRERPSAEPVLSQVCASGVDKPMPAQKSTLHSFWRIAQPLPPQDVPMMTDSTPHLETGERCEDCDGSLQSEDAMDMDGGSGDKTCASCRRSVCDGCAVFGNERTCAACSVGGEGRGW